MLSLRRFEPWTNPRLSVHFFVNSQYWVCAIIARIGFVITGMSKLMTPVTAVLYFGLLYLLFLVGALRKDDDDED